MEMIGIYDSSMYMHVGDSYESDALGAIAAKWRSALIYTKSLPSSYRICPPTIVVSSIQELYELFCEAFDQQLL